MVRRSYRGGLGSASFTRLRETMPAGPTGPPTYPRRGSEVEYSDPTRGLGMAWPVTAGGGVWVHSVTLTWFLPVREEHRNPAWDLWQPGMWRLEAGTRVLQPLIGSTNGQEECSWATNCCLLEREEEVSYPVLHSLPLPSSWDPETDKPLLYLCFGSASSGTKQNNKILHPALPRGGRGDSPSPTSSL